MTQLNTTAWAYLVVSDPGQAETLGDQRAWADEAARLHGWTITRTISGVSSGKLGARKLTTEMIVDLEALEASRRPSRLLMIRLERLGRGDGLEAMEAFLRVRRLGIVVHTRLDGDVGYDRASELLMPVLRFFIGGMENEVRRDKLLSHYERRREAHKTDPTMIVGPALPYGLGAENGHYIPQDPEASTVKLIYDLRLQGYGSHIIAKRIAKSAPPMQMRSGLLLPQKWTADRVRRLVIKEIYRYTIVDEETWHRAQIPAREVSRKSKFHKYSLRGALRCECGYALIGSGKADTSLQHYFCRNLDAHNGRMLFHRAKWIEEQFIQILDRLEADDQLLDSFADATRPDESVNVLRSQLATLRGEHSRLEDRRRRLFAAFEEGALAREDLQWRLDDLKDVEHELDSKILTLEKDVAVALAMRTRVDELRALVAGASELFRKADNDDQVALAKAVSKALGGLYVTTRTVLKIGSPAKLPVRNPRHSDSQKP